MSTHFIVIKLLSVNCHNAIESTGKCTGACQFYSFLIIIIIMIIINVNYFETHAVTCVAQSDLFQKCRRCFAAGGHLGTPLAAGSRTLSGRFLHRWAVCPASIRAAACACSRIAGPIIIMRGVRDFTYQW